jgi:hypothetical protein
MQCRENEGDLPSRRAGLSATLLKSDRQSRQPLIDEEEKSFVSWYRQVPN